jgi:hypothetical protein
MPVAMPTAELAFDAQGDYGMSLYVPSKEDIVTLTTAVIRQLQHRRAQQHQ